MLHIDDVNNRVFLFFHSFYKFFKQREYKITNGPTTQKWTSYTVDIKKKKYKSDFSHTIHATNEVIYNHNRNNANIVGRGYSRFLL